ncbi:MAG: mevalonate kinase [Chloroflexi bacterium]|nr:mevalonate kinase [Chloroflexota bacterium]
MSSRDKSPNASAPGKVILLGEHAVVYGQPAIAFPVSALRTRVTVDVADQLRVTSAIWDRSYQIADVAMHADPVYSAISLTAEALGIPIPIRHYTIESDIPAASGLGSGAALSTALGRSVALAAGIDIDPAVLNDVVFEVERLYHGTPSGIDNTVVVYEQPVYFVRGHPIQRLHVRGEYTFVVADTGIRAPTRESVADVRALMVTQPAATTAAVSAIGELATRTRDALAVGDSRDVGNCMNQNHSLLQQLTVSSPELDRLVQAAIDAGAIGAKLSGGGRGGNMIALVASDTAPAVEAALRAAGAAHAFVTVLRTGTEVAPR